MAYANIYVQLSCAFNDASVKKVLDRYGASLKPDEYYHAYHVNGVEESKTEDFFKEFKKVKGVDFIEAASTKKWSFRRGYEGR
jgi:hypothetical protein